MNQIEKAEKTQSSQSYCFFILRFWVNSGLNDFHPGCSGWSRLPLPANAPASHPKRSCSDHLRVRSEMSLRGSLLNVTHPRWQPKCTIYHDLTGSAPEGPSDRTMGLHGSARMEQGKAPSGSLCNPGGSWEISH